MEPDPMSYLNRYSLLLFCLLFLAGCSGSSAFFPGAHKIEIRQGNVITQEMVDQLEIGMTKRQVRFVLGTPLLVDTFSGERWDYYFSDDKRDGEVVTKGVTLLFENELLSNIDSNL
jgi:outer membrane protein assembly factor BamE